MLSIVRGQERIQCAGDGVIFCRGRGFVKPFLVFTHFDFTLSIIKLMNVAVGRDVFVIKGEAKLNFRLTLTPPT